MDRQHRPHSALPAWQRLRGLATAESSQTAPTRHLEACGLQVDLGLQDIGAQVQEALLELAEQCQLTSELDALFRGETVNHSENRPALHSRLRDIDAEGRACDREVNAQLKAMAELAGHWHRGGLTGFSGQPLQRLVNIGIGGSDLGPRMVCAALAPTAQTRFVANIDSDDFLSACAGLDPARTLFSVCSKSFTTAETNANTERARAWLRAAGCPEHELGRHFVAVTAHPDRAVAAGFIPERILTFQEWVGGRYSLWSPVGISVALTLGMEAFHALLRGARDMDRHVARTPVEHNLAARLALSDVWNFSFRGAESLAVLPYAQRLALLPAHLQQLFMESNGKRVDRGGHTLDCHSGMVVWGAAGTTGQHSFHQLLHQGTRRIVNEFVLPLVPVAPADTGAHRALAAHCLAQVHALRQGESGQALHRRLIAEGRDPDAAQALLAHAAVPGGRWCTLITLPQVDAYHLGALLALYEHRVYCSAVLWDINAFDQWGVELGKRISAELEPVLAGASGAVPPELSHIVDAYRAANGAAHPNDKHRNE